MNWGLLALAVVLGVAWLLVRAAMNERAFEDAHPETGQRVTVNGHDIAYDITGSGPPIVLIHGASGNYQDMTYALAPALADRYRVISVDRPGLGHSPALHRGGETLKEQADILAAAVQKLGYKRVYLLGQSYGGSVALSWAINHPDMVAGMVLVAAPSNDWEGGLGLLYALNSNAFTGPVMRLLIAAFPPHAMITRTIKTIFAPQPVPPGYEAHIAPALTIRRKVQRANALQLASLKAQVRAMVPRYGDIKVPVELIHGTADTIVPETVHNTKLVTQLPDAHETILPGVGHMPHLTNTQSVSAAVDHMHAKARLKSAA